MQGARSRYGLLVSALGAVLLAVAVFLPWYGVVITPQGVAAAQQTSQEVAQQFGNAALQAQVGSEQGTIATLAGREIASLSAHQALHDMNVILLVLAGLALLDALLPLARTGVPVPDGAGRAVALLGCVAALCVGYRMVHPPSVVEGVFDLNLREGAWLALFGCLMMALGGIWPRSAMLLGDGESGGARPGSSGDPFAALSGWTPGS